MTEALKFRTRPHEVEAMRITGKEDVARDICEWVLRAETETEAKPAAWLESVWGKDRWGVIITTDESRANGLPGEWVVRQGNGFIIWTAEEFEAEHEPRTEALPVPKRPLVIAPTYTDFRHFCLKNDISPGWATYVVSEDQLRGPMDTILYIVGARPGWLTEDMLMFGRLEVQEV